MATSESRKLFVNIAVDDLDRSVEFFTQLGFTFNPLFTDETATCMIVSDEAFFMLLTKPRFGDFTTKELSDPSSRTEAIYSFSADTREAVDELADTALAAGAQAAKEPMDMGFMYARSFHDLDGHHWEVIWMDPAAAEQDPHADATTAA